MTIRENILSDISNIADPALLNQVFEYIQLLKLNDSLKKSNLSDVLKFAGSLSKNEAAEIQKIVSQEFEQIEGDW